LRQRPHFVQDTRRPFIELSHVVTLQGELILGAALACSDAQVLADLHEEAGAGHARELATDPPKDLVCGEPALFERFEGHEHAPAIDRPAVGAACEHHDVLHGGILSDDRGELGDALLHRLE
jgi:hypothetical protein